jgi:hypothetical protein
MKQPFILFRRGGVYYSEDVNTGKQISLRTKDEGEALTLLHAKNESVRQPMLNLRIARTYLAASDPEVGKRPWQAAMDEMSRGKRGPTLVRYGRAMEDEAFDLIRNRPILETQAAEFREVLSAGTVATNVFLRRLHNFAMDMNWLPWPVLPKKAWPKVRFKEKRAVMREEHEAIVAGEGNPERKAFSELCWHLGGAQSDIASLTAEDVDRSSRSVAFRRKKTGVVSIIRFDAEVEAVPSSLPSSGPLFPKLRLMREAHRATEFRRACRRLKSPG